MTQPSVADLFAPITLDEFFRDHAFKQPLLIRGSADKFESLFNWDSLNRILSYSRHDPIRVHLDRVGATEGDLRFTREVTNVRGERISRIDVERLYRCLGEGATLVVDAVNEIDPSVASVSEELAALLSTPRATTVLFASFGRTPGFSIHWDSRDVYALQVEGRKHWRVFGPSVIAPLDRGAHDVPGCGEPGPPFWEGTVERGDLLYIPRGWWHEVSSDDSPSVHLGLGFAAVTGLDFLSALTEDLYETDLMRLDMPLFGTDEELASFELALKDEIAAKLSSMSIADFVASTRARAAGHTRVSLPLGVHRNTFTPAADALVRVSNRMTVQQTSSSEVRLVGDGREIVLPPGVAAVTERLLACNSASVAGLADAAPDVPLAEVQDVVASLIAEGFVHVVPAPGTT